MKKRGPRSAASLEVALPSSSVIEPVSRPDAPYDLTDEQAQEWWAVTQRLPADWFPRETHGLLAQYCRHVVAARRVAQLITTTEQSRKLDIREYDRLLQMQEREGRAMSSLATRMRISQQATVRHELAHKPDSVDNPWEFEVGQSKT
jgi:chaperone required for assembly of F1-ATPase